MVRDHSTASSQSRIIIFLSWPKAAKKKKTEVVIHGRNGKIRSKDSYGNDPNPPKDREH